MFILISLLVFCVLVVVLASGKEDIEVIRGEKEAVKEKSKSFIVGK